MDTTGSEPAILTEAIAARLSGTSARDLAKLSGWGRTTVTEIVMGRRLPTQVQLEDLLTAAGVEAGERKIWAARLAEAQVPVVPSETTDAVGGENVPVSASRWETPGGVRRRALWVGVLVLVCVGVAWWWFRPPSREVGGQVRCLTGGPVVGVFLAPERGPGSWARVRPGADGAVVFNGEVGADQYRVFVGCSGTPQQWGAESRSGWLTAPDVQLVCDDRPGTVSVAPYFGRCEVLGVLPAP